MGMFDTYRVTLPCPLDGFPLDEWQGKDGPCVLWTWTPGQLHPLESLEPLTEADYAPERFLGQMYESMRPGFLFGAAKATLPERFRFYEWHGDHMVEALGRCRDQIWTESEPVEVWASLGTGETEEVADVRNPGQTMTVEKHVRTVLWHHRTGLNAEGMALRERYRASLRARLPKYGGGACCQLCRDRDVPAVAYVSSFVCEAHLRGRTKHAAGSDDFVID